MAATRLQRHRLGPDTARADDLHPLVIAFLRGLPILVRNDHAAATDKARGNLLGYRLPLRIQALGEQVQLPLHQRLDTPGQRAPLQAAAPRSDAQD